MSEAAAITGNRCGHFPMSPRPFVPPTHHKRRPGVLTELLERASRYYRRPDILPTLNAANQSVRQQRSERREACLAFLGALVHYLDVKTLRVGRPNQRGQFGGISMEELAGHAGLTLRRAERAAADLVKAGIMKVHRICEEVGQGSYKGFAAIRTLSAHLFESLGLGGRLSAERKKAHRRQKAEKLTRNQKGRQGLMMNVLRNQLEKPAVTNLSRDEHLANLRQAIPPPDDK